MADRIVMQSGGDYATLASALAAASAGDVIRIQGTWSADDTAVCTIADDNITIQAEGVSRHPGYVPASPSHYRLRCATNGSHCISVSNTGAVIDGLEIKQASTGDSDECIRIGAASITLTVKNCLIYTGNSTVNQDGIYHGLLAGLTINLTSDIIFDCYRAGFHAQVYSNIAGTGLVNTYNINSCTFFNSGKTNAAAGTASGNIGIVRYESDLTQNVNIYNTIAVGKGAGTGAADYNQQGTAGGTVTWNIHDSIDSDNSIASRDGAASGCLASRTATDSDTPGAGDWVIFQDKTTSPFDLRLKSNAENDAQDMHANNNGAGISAPSADIVGTSRPQGTNYDCGAFEYVVASGASVIPLVMHHLKQMRY